MSAKLSGIIEKSEQEAVEGLLRNAGFEPGKCVFNALSGDGSDRKFIRAASGNRSVLLVMPSGSPAGKLEAFSGWKIGRHLRDREVPVPEMISYDSETGAILCEDLGDVLFQQYAQQVNKNELKSLYQDTIDILVNMQTKGCEGFSAEMCWDQPVYDRKTMLERESGYFLEACCSRILGKNSAPAGLSGEFSDLADLAGRQSTNYFLHRDFQSRNIMVKDGRLRVIDFQGGRFGPLGYDLASLLIDPYVQLPDALKTELLEYYVECASDVMPLDRNEFMGSYSWLAIQRNLQILGAFAFLSMVKGKSFFRQFLYPASVTLLGMLDMSREKFPALQSVTKDLIVHLKGNFSHSPED